MFIYTYTVNNSKHHFVTDSCHEPDEDIWYDSIIENAAREYFENHDGWEAKWPLDIELFYEGKSLGVFTVEQEQEPVFYAYKKDDKNENT